MPIEDRSLASARPPQFKGLFGGAVSPLWPDNVLSLVARLETMPPLRGDDGAPRGDGCIGGAVSPLCVATGLSLAARVEMMPLDGVARACESA